MSTPIERLREKMRARGIDAYIVPSSDPHQNEYVPLCWQRRGFVSGFTGSAGDLVVTLDQAGLWTDSRYYLQAESQLDGSGITLFKLGLSDTPKMTVWIKAALGNDGRVGLDPKVFSHRQVQRLQKTLGRDAVVCIEPNLVDDIWTEQDELPTAPAEVWPEAFAGESVSSKLERVRDAMSSAGADALVITTLDAVAWLFNIRGRDVPFNPVLISYAIVSSDGASLFVHDEKITPALEAHLRGLADIHAYDAFAEHLATLSETTSSVMADPERVSQWVIDRLGNTGSVVLAPNPIVRLKAVKNHTEIAGFRAAHIRDGVAMVRFLHWLSEAVPVGGVTEVSAAEQLAAFRAEGERYQGESFAPISAFGANGAIVHYDPTEAETVALAPEGIYLIDSGGQYLDGTTDITRTVCLGEPTDRQRECFTRVLRGHINLASAAFPVGTFGTQLDTIARKPLWDAGLNYGHGTGHGVGAYLNVHEGPQAISYFRGNGVPLEPGMVLSNEPGYYQDGAFGIRIENLICVIPDELRTSGNAPFLRFETFTLCPIDRTLVVPEMLCGDELTYLNEYHARVRETLSPLLDDPARAWLERATEPISP